ncbi:hypothetical protein BLX87_18110 [Bacillus sp. VT-16-64]|nr:hypothetical protein BLX87_18110 [Bacillus sp. VT-16-64]
MFSSVVPAKQRPVLQKFIPACAGGGYRKLLRKGPLRITKTKLLFAKQVVYYIIGIKHII